MIHIEGKVVDIMPETSGVGKSGRQWRERAAVINHVDHEQYPKNVVVAFKGEAVDTVNTLRVGDVVSCDISIDAHEYRGKFFNEIKGFGLKKV